MRGTINADRVCGQIGRSGSFGISILARNQMLTMQCHFSCAGFQIWATHSVDVHTARSATCTDSRDIGLRHAACLAIRLAHQAPHFAVQSTLQTIPSNSIHTYTGLHRLVDFTQLDSMAGSIRTLFPTPAVYGVLKASRRFLQYGIHGCFRSVGSGFVKDI